MTTPATSAATTESTKPPQPPQHPLELHPELPRNRENSFCCGAGGAQFWKEEEEGNQRISDNRFREAQKTLAPAAGEKILAVGCPFCKSMLGSTPTKADSEDIAIKDVAELLLEGVRRSKGLTAAPIPQPAASAAPQPNLEPVTATPAQPPAVETLPTEAPPAATPAEPPVERRKWQPKSAAPTQPAQNPPIAAQLTEQASATEAIRTSPAPERKKWQPKSAGTLPEQIGPGTFSEVTPIAQTTPARAAAPVSATSPNPEAIAPERKKWQPKSATPTPASEPIPTVSTETATSPASTDAPTRKKWNPKKPS
ncbi:heterodisulfide reductase-related iron-sulfur binding cluster [Tunturiibacter empetritectus]|uniref:heterodisulfide reductase-related iron-sulfur binding cluster n=1 Tax=Tunturiibacter empetritectus TaxID=3069691 RepID=UPI003D9B215E